MINRLLSNATWFCYLKALKLHILRINLFSQTHLNVTSQLHKTAGQRAGDLQKVKQDRQEVHLVNNQIFYLIRVCTFLTTLPDWRVDEEKVH